MKNLEKQKLLITSMCNLPLGTSFTIIFRGSIFSLQSFINHNPFVKKEEDFFEFVMFGNKHAAFKRKSKKWEMLKNFLLEKGFTCEDWPMLLPKIKGSDGRLVYDFSLLSKEKLLDIPIDVICPGKSTSYCDANVRVSDALKSDIHFCRSQNGALVIQRKLKFLGFSKEDGEFMKINNPKLKTKEYFVSLLTEKREFTIAEAITAIDLGLRAGWIHVD